MLEAVGESGLYRVLTEDLCHIVEHRVGFGRSHVAGPTHWTEIHVAAAAGGTHRPTGSRRGREKRDLDWGQKLFDRGQFRHAVRVAGGLRVCGVKLAAETCPEFIDERRAEGIRVTKGYDLVTKVERKSRAES